MPIGLLDVENTWLQSGGYCSQFPDQLCFEPIQQILKGHHVMGFLLTKEFSNIQDLSPTQIGVYLLSKLLSQFLNIRSPSFFLSQTSSSLTEFIEKSTIIQNFILVLLNLPLYIFLQYTHLILQILVDVFRNLSNLKKFHSGQSQDFLYLGTDGVDWVPPVFICFPVFISNLLLSTGIPRYAIGREPNLQVNMSSQDHSGQCFSWHF